MNGAAVAVLGCFLSVPGGVDYAEPDQAISGRIGARRVWPGAQRQAGAGWQIQWTRWSLRGEFGNGALPC